MTASAIVMAPSVVPLPREAQRAVSVDLAAAVHTLSQADVQDALATIEQFAPGLRLPAAPNGVVTTAAVGNAASDFVSWAYSGIIYWTDYFALQLAPYVLGFIPFGWVITDQIFAIYPPIIDFTNSVVYDLINPVLNNPLNPAVWANGIGAVAYTGVASLINIGINEVNLFINYFLGWIPPLPPLPPWPFSAAANATTFAEKGMLTSEFTAMPALAKDALSPISTLANALKTDLAAETGIAAGVAAATTTKVAKFTEGHAEEALGLANTPRAVLMGAVQAQGKVTRSIVKAATDINEAAATGGPAKTAKAVGDAPGKVVKGLTTGADKVVKSLKKAASQTRKAVRAAHATAE